MSQNEERKAVCDEVPTNVNLSFSSQDFRDTQTQKTEERIRVVQELRNLSLAEADRAVG